jgi:hypothetical protein
MRQPSSMPADDDNVITILADVIGEELC